jgi:hypothetical protein
MIPYDSFEEPLNAIDYVLKHFIHLERGLLADFVKSCLDYVQVTECGKENRSDRSVRPRKPLLSTDIDHSHGPSSSKRSLDDVDFEPLPFG